MEGINFKLLIYFFVLLSGCSTQEVEDKYYYQKIGNGKIKLFLENSTNSQDSDHLTLEFFTKEKLPKFNDVHFILESNCCVIKRDSLSDLRYFEFLVNDVDALYENNKWVVLELKNNNKLVKKIKLYRKQKIRRKEFIGH